MAQQPLVGKGLVIDVLRSNSDTPHFVECSGRVISTSQRPLPANTQLSQQTDIYAPGGIQTRNPIARETANPLLRLRGHWDRFHIIQGYS